jgi:hypothetical protein
LFGVHWWYSGGATEEILRWESALYRHYCIEGATDLLSRRYGWTYALDHIANPDFLDELKGWTAEPAAPDSLKTGYLERYACAQGRYWQRSMEPDEPSGNAYLWMRRQAGRPNKVSQKVRNLVPAALLGQMITADYPDIQNGRSSSAARVSLDVDGAQSVDQGKIPFRFRSSSYSQFAAPLKNGRQGSTITA